MRRRAHGAEVRPPLRWDRPRFAGRRTGAAAHRYDVGPSSPRNPHDTHSRPNLVSGAAGDEPPVHPGERPEPDRQADVGTALFITISRLCRAGDDRLDPTFTFRFPGAPSSPPALLFKVAAQSRKAGGKARSLRDLIATAGVTGLPVVLYCDADATAGRRPDPLEALFALPATRATVGSAHGAYQHRPVLAADGTRSRSTCSHRRSWNVSGGPDAVRGISHSRCRASHRRRGPPAGSAIVAPLPTQLGPPDKRETS